MKEKRQRSGSRRSKVTQRVRDTGGRREAGAQGEHDSARSEEKEPAPGVGATTTPGGAEAARGLAAGGVQLVTVYRGRRRQRGEAKTLGAADHDSCPDLRSISRRAGSTSYLHPLGRNQVLAPVPADRPGPRRLHRGHHSCSSGSSGGAGETSDALEALGFATGMSSVWLQALRVAGLRRSSWFRAPIYVFVFFGARLYAEPPRTWSTSSSTASVVLVAPRWGTAPAVLIAHLALAAGMDPDRRRRGRFDGVIAVLGPGPRCGASARCHERIASLIATFMIGRKLLRTGRLSIMSSTWSTSCCTWFATST